MKIALCTIIKNEEKFLSIFLQHYEKIGVDSFIIIDNDDKEKCDYIPVKDNVIVIDTTIRNMEDLNIAYVALTRARNNMLVINWSNLEQMWLQQKKSSRFG